MAEDGLRMWEVGKVISIFVRLDSAFRNSYIFNLPKLIVTPHVVFCLAGYEYTYITCT